MTAYVSKLVHMKIFTTVWKHLLKFNNKDTKTISDDILLSIFEPSPYRNDI